MLVRSGPKGDLFGLRRGGLSEKKLRENPHGIVLGEHWPTGVLGKKVRHRGGKVRLDPPEIVEEAERLAARAEPSAEFPLLLIGLRELRSHNSWMHNSEKLMRGEMRRHTARIHPEDAAELGIEDGATVRIASAHGEIETEAQLTDEVKRGHDRGPARLGSPRRQLAPRGRRRRRERERPHVDRPRRPRAARRHGPPERDPGAAWRRRP